MIRQSQIDDYNRKKLANLIREVSDLHGGEPEFDTVTGEVLGESFLSEYIAEVVKEWSNNLPAAIQCFEELKAQAIFLGKMTSKDTKSKVVSKDVKSQGHGAFRNHYAELEREAGREPMAAKGQDVSGKVT